MLVEAAPLRGLIGQLGVRAEVMPWPKVALGLSHARVESASERADFTDTAQTFVVEGLFYPLGQKDWPVFVGGGIAHETAELGREAGRPTLTWARTRSDELHDQWTNVDTYWSLQQTIGYRVLTSYLFTAALRYTRDEVMTTSSRNVADNVVADQKLDTRGRAPIRQSISLHAGLYLP